MPLPRKATTGAFEPVNVNVWDIDTKKIIFSGSQSDAARHINVTPWHLADALKKKYRLLKKYAIRAKSEKS